jgi:hypothetical protein
MPVTREYDVPLMVARGHSSETFAYNAAEAMRETGKPCYVYYVGDFDPSGWQMARSLEQKLTEFGAPVVFERLAVNPEQIQAWDLPTRPSKVTDTRCKAFFAELGDGTESVELDAIHPDLLRGLVRDAIEQHIDNGQLEALQATLLEAIITSKHSEQNEMAKRIALASVFIVALLAIAGVFYVHRYRVIETSLKGVAAVWVVDPWVGEARFCFSRPLGEIGKITGFRIECSGARNITRDLKLSELLRQNS